MSPDDIYNDAFWRDKEDEVVVTDIRHSFAFVFQQVAWIHKIHYRKEKALSTKFDDIKVAVEKMYFDGVLNDYLYENLQSCFKQYPTMLIGNLKDEEKKIGREKQLERLRKLKEFLQILIGDLSGEINDLTNQEIDSDTKELLREYFN